jgi:hypothetical protein
MTYEIRSWSWRRSRPDAPTPPWGACLLALVLGMPVPALAQADSVPAAHGRLSGDVIAVRLDAGSVQFRITPLHPQIIQLLKPDVYQPLHRLLTSMWGEIKDEARRYGVSDPSVFYVTAYSSVDQAVFSPENITITNRSRLFRPISIIPMSALWSQYRLQQRETASAVYVFDGAMEIWEPMTFAYGSVVSDQWGRILPILERERSWVQSQSKQP